MVTCPELMQTPCNKGLFLTWSTKRLSLQWQHFAKDDIRERLAQRRRHNFAWPGSRLQRPAGGCGAVQEKGRHFLLKQKIRAGIQSLRNRPRLDKGLLSGQRRLAANAIWWAYENESAALISPYGASRVRILTGLVWRRNYLRAGRYRHKQQHRSSPPHACQGDARTFGLAEQRQLAVFSSVHARKLRAGSALSPQSQGTGT